MLPALLAAGSSIVGGLISGNAASKAAKAQVQAQQIADRRYREAAQRAEELQQPYLQAGYGGLNALTARLGLPTQGVSSAIDRAAAGGINTDWAAYGRANPDLAAEASRVVASGEFPDEASYYRWHYQNLGQGEGRAAPPTVEGYQSPTAAGANDMVDSGAYASPNALTVNSPGVYGHTQDPTYQDPGEFSFSIEDFKNNPAYQFALEQGTGQVLASAAATGALQSGAALKALQDRGQKTAYNFYNQERDFARQSYDTDRKFNRDIYENDRNYLTTRFDRGTDDLFRLSDRGQNAAGVVTNTAIGAANQGAQAARGIADAKAGNALQQGAIWSGVVGDVPSLLAGSVRQNALTADRRRAAAANPQLF